MHTPAQREEIEFARSVSGGHILGRVERTPGGLNALIQKSTCLVLGAGASAPYGLLTGHDLRNEIMRDVDQAGTPLRDVLRSLGFGRYGLLRQFAEALRGAQQPSVDTFLSNRMDEFLEVGKAAIAAVLIQREDDNRLAPVDDHWYEYLWGALSSDGRASFGGNKLSIVTFNYDRSLEWYLIRSFRHTYGCDWIEAENSVNSVVRIVHVHGQLGELSTGAIGGDKRLYSTELNTSIVQVAAQGIIILPQADETSAEFRAAAQLINGAEQVVFSGFGYLDENLTRLGLTYYDNHGPEPPVRLLGSAYKSTTLERTRLQYRWRVEASDQRCLSYLRNHVEFD